MRTFFTIIFLAVIGAEIYYYFMKGKIVLAERTVAVVGEFISKK